MSLVQITPTLYQTEHCVFVIDSTVPWNSPTAAYNAIYAPSGGTFPNLAAYFDALTTRFPGNYFSVCYMANTGAPNVPNYIDRIFKATGIQEPGTAGAPQSFSTVDICRYNLSSGTLFTPVLGVFDHELGHAWGAQLFNGLTPPALSNGHWLGNSTVDCQLSAFDTDDSYVTVRKIHGDPVNGFSWQRVDNGRSNDFEVFSEQELYLMGVHPTFPTSYVLNAPVYHADLTMSYSSVDVFDQAGAVAAYGARNPDYKTAPKQFRLGFVYVARDAAEVNAVYQAVEQSIDHFCNAEAISTTAYRAQIPFLCDARYRASVDGRLADLDGNATPLLIVNDPYVMSADGTATIGFLASDPDGPTPVVSVVPASAQCIVSGGSVHVSGLPQGVHFFTLKAMDAGGKKSFGHFVVEVQRPAGSIVISAQPASRLATAGNAASFDVTAAGPGTLGYQWYRQGVRTSTWEVLADGGGYAGVTTSGLMVTASPAADGDRFLCVVTNANGAVTSSLASLTVNETPPQMATQPANKNATPGNSTFFDVAAADTGTTFGYYHYQWQRAAAGGGPWADLSPGGAYNGVNTAHLGVTGLTLGMDGDQFRCRVSNTAGDTPSAAATLAVGSPPAITTQPQPVSGVVGQTVIFSVAATGTGPLSYQWYRFGAPVGNAPTLTLTNVQAGDAGTYGVFVTSPFGLAFSNNVALTISAAAVPNDFNGDGKPDILWRHPATGDVGVWLMNGTNVSSYVYIGGVGPPWQIVGTADFNGDGKADILWRHPTTGDVGVWLMNGTNVSSYVYIGGVGSPWQIAGTADFNGDGKPDILWRNPTTGDVGTWLMNGTVVSSYVYIGGVGGPWQIGDTGDFNGDGKPDILWRNPATGDVGAWLMNGTVVSSYVYIGGVGSGWNIKN